MSLDAQEVVEAIHEPLAEVGSLMVALSNEDDDMLEALVRPFLNTYIRINEGDDSVPMATKVVASIIYFATEGARAVRELKARK